MRRSVIAGSAAAALVWAAVAAAGVLNTYSATLSFSPATPGGRGTPSPLRFTENLMAGGTGGNRTAPLSDVQVRLYGLVARPNGFPTCSEERIAVTHSDAGCSHSAMIATGDLAAVIGPTTDTSTGAVGTFDCNPLVHVWNGGNGGDVFFFVVRPPNHACGPIRTGDVGPFTGTIKRQGRFLVFDTPIPPYVSFPLTGLEGSIEALHLTTLGLTRRVNGKTIALLGSVACQAGERPYSVSFTVEQTRGGSSQTTSVSHKAKC